MDSISDRCGAIWQRVRSSPAQLPAQVAIPRSHVADGSSMGSAFTKDQDYFQIRFNQVFLSDRRKWWSEYDPMALAVTEFIYDKSMQAVPFIVGPSLVQKYGQKVPAGMLFQDTRVAGIHPYRGGPVKTTVMLFRVQRQDYGRKLLNMAESAASVLDFSSALTMYVKLANVLLDGVEALFGMDTVQPVTGLRREFDPDAGDLFEPGFFALIDPHDTDFRPEQLWVRDRQLFSGDSLETATPFRAGDFILYSIVQSKTRSDDSTLPFYEQFERAKKEAGHADASSWLRARADDAVLWQRVLASPDLTEPHADELSEVYRARIQKIHDYAVDHKVLGPAPGSGAQPAKLQQATALLES